jgi:hypothetical protein
MQTEPSPTRVAAGIAYQSRFTPYRSGVSLSLMPPISGAYQEDARS